MSRLHAECGGEWTISDDGLSQNRTWVNDSPHRAAPPQRRGSGARGADGVHVLRSGAGCDRPDARAGELSATPSFSERPARALPPAVHRRRGHQPGDRQAHIAEATGISSRRSPPSSTTSAVALGLDEMRRRSACGDRVAGDAQRAGQRGRGRLSPRARAAHGSAISSCARWTARSLGADRDLRRPARQAKNPARTAQRAPDRCRPWDRPRGADSEREIELRVPSRRSRSARRRRHRLSLRMSRCTRLSPSSSARSAALTSGCSFRARPARRGRVSRNGRGSAATSGQPPGRPPLGDRAARTACTIEHTPAHRRPATAAASGRCSGPRDEPIGLEATRRGTKGRDRGVDAPLGASSPPVRLVVDRAFRRTRCARRPAWTTRRSAFV